MSGYCLEFVVLMLYFFSTLLVSMSTLLSRILGFIRTLLIASLLGAGIENDAFNVAVRFASFLRRILAEGAFSAAFIPSFIAILNKHDEDKANRFASRVLAILLVLVVVIVMLFEIFSKKIIMVILPGFTGERFDLALSYSRICFLYLFFISINAFFSSVLNSYKRFIFGGTSQVIGNIVFIVFILLFAYSSPNTGRVCAIAVVVSSIAQMLWTLLPCLTYNIRPLVSQAKDNDYIRNFFKSFLLTLAGTGASQVNVLIGTMIASMLPSGSISYLGYAERLCQLPVSVLGTAIATVLLPFLSYLHKNIEEIEFQNRIARSIVQALMISVLAAILIFQTADIVVPFIYQRGKFDAIASAATINTLYAFSFGIPALILTKICNAVLFSVNRYKIPMYSTIISVVIDIFLSLYLIKIFSYVGIAIAISLSSWANFAILIFMSRRVKAIVFNNELIRGCFVVGGALIVCIYIPPYCGKFFVSNLARMLVLIFSTISLYTAILICFKALSIQSIRNIIKKILSH